MIDIPDDYWTIRPRGFQAFVGPFAEAFTGLAGDVVAAAAPLVGADGHDAANAVATVDGDQATIRGDAATERTAIDTTPTGDVLARYGQGDALADNVATHDPGGFTGEPTWPTPPSFNPGPPKGGFPGGGPGGDDSADQPTSVPAPPPAPVQLSGAEQPTAAPAPPVIASDGGPADAATSGSGDAGTGDGRGGASSPATSDVVAPDAQPITRRELRDALAQLSPTITLVV